MDITTNPRGPLSKNPLDRSNRVKNRLLSWADGYSSIGESQMRTITKALITLMAAITMCLMPLSIMDDAEAATIILQDFIENFTVADARQP